MDTAPIFGYHAVYEDDYLSSVRSAGVFGFQYVQFDLNVPTFFLEGISRRYLKTVRKTAEDLGVAISFHAPGEHYGLFTDSPTVRRGFLDQMKLILDRANYLNAHHVTMHLLRPPLFRRADSGKDELQSTHYQYYTRILQENLMALAKASGSVLVAVENFYLERLAIEALDELFAKGARIWLALDWAKLHAVNGARIKEQYLFFRRHLDSIREIHVHDMNAMAKQHMVIGRGILDFRPLLSNFYDGRQWLTVEVRPITEAVKARDEFLEMIRKT
jgi:sugar phosphate isomerase/epimerase